LFIEDIYLQTTRDTILPTITQAHSSTLKRLDALYALRHVRTSEKITPSGTSSLEYDLFQPGELPYNITIVFLPSNTFNGDSVKEPIYFEQYGLEKASLRTENKSIEYYYEYMRSAYFNTLKALDEKNVNISFLDFAKRLFFIYFDLTEGAPSGTYRFASRTNLRLSPKWA
jgi:hypothetical protein